MAIEHDADHGLSVAIVGATGAVGGDLIAALERSTLPVAQVRPIASSASAGTTVDVAGRAQRVHPLPPDLADSELLGNVDLVFFCTPPDVTRAHAMAIADTGLAVIDIGAACADRAPVMVPAAAFPDMQAFSEVRVACSPSAPAVLLACVGGALLRAGAAAVRGLILVPAGLAGRAGPEELSGQVVALFNGQDPPRDRFPAGLAFDVLGTVGEGPGWTDVEARVAAEAGAALGVEPAVFGVGIAMAPVFAGMAAGLFAEWEPCPDMETVAGILGAVPGARVGDPVPGPRRTVGSPGVHLGRLRADPSGRGLHLWATADNLRFGASANALAIAAMLHKDGLL